MEITINGFTFSEEKADERRTENKEKYKAKLNFLLAEKENIYNEFVSKIKEALKPISGLYEEITFNVGFSTLYCYLEIQNKIIMVISFYFNSLEHLYEIYASRYSSNIESVEVKEVLNNPTIKEAAEKYFQKLKEIERLRKNWERHKRVA